VKQKENMPHLSYNFTAWHFSMKSELLSTNTTDKQLVGSREAGSLQN